jgi:16S rRNA (cytosine967-C5)-methyltransferase
LVCLLKYFYLKFYSSHITSAIEVINNVSTEIPLHLQLQHFFKANKKIGSKDRKQIAHYCYCYFRALPLGKQAKIQDSIAIGLFLTETENHPALAALNPELNNIIENTFEKKLEQLSASAGSFFSFGHLLSPLLNANEFALSHIKQPKVFLRIRNNEATIKETLTKNNIAFEEIDFNCLAVANSTKISELLSINTEVVVQDYSSQQVLKTLNNLWANFAEPIKVWDCCAASGGKSILLLDSTTKKIQLTVSDVRESILKNLKQRFKEAGIKNYNSFLHDATSSKALTLKKQNIILCDVPCTGSGTWARTPEQHIFFNEEKLIQFTTKQFQIAFNAIKHLEQNGILIYITCSAFKAENEDVVEKLVSNTALKLISQNYIMGYSQQADTMFVALLSL